MTATPSSRPIRLLWPIHLLGYWCSDFEPHFPAPQAWVDPNWHPREREAVAAYLDKGSLFMTQCGLSWCRFHCGEKSMGYREWTDGYFYWPEGLSHYVRCHQVRPPAAFVDHVLHRPWAGYWRRRLLYEALRRWPGVSEFPSDDWWHSFRSGTVAGAGEIQ